MSPLHAAPAAEAGGTIWTRWHPQLSGACPSASTPRRSLACTTNSYGPRVAKLTLVPSSGAARRCPRRAAPGDGQIPPASPALPRPAAAPASRALPGSLHTEEARPPRPDAQRVCVEPGVWRRVPGPAAQVSCSPGTAAAPECPQRHSPFPAWLCQPSRALDAEMCR